jgi:hypothetical protein
MVELVGFEKMETLRSSEVLGVRGTGRHVCQVLKAGRLGTRLYEK